MELKITADKKLLEALDKLSASISALTGSQGSVAAAPEPASIQTQPAATPTDPAAQTPAAPVTPTREDIHALAVRIIQAGGREEVKALLNKYEAPRISAVPLNVLTDFKADLEKLEGLENAGD